MLMNIPVTYGSSALACDVKFYSIPELQKMTGWSEKTVQKLFNDPEFPATDLGRNKLVEAHALINYFSKRRSKNTNRYWK